MFEVIRGTGGALWGANAANGIINIITKHVEASLVGTNLLDNEHLEFSNRNVAPTETERAIYAKFTWRF